VDNLGKNLRALRTTKELTLAQLGEKVGLSASYLSQVERGVTMPSLSRLTSIAIALGVEMRYFFEDDVASPRVVRANQGTTIRESAGIHLELLSADTPGMNFQSYCVVCRPGARREYTVLEPGEECGFVLKGELVVTVGEEVYVLAAGDSIHYYRHHPHSWHNSGDDDCVVLWTVSPPVSDASLKARAV
jgi:transcriptional regulator with XRE-family HTH domain